MAHRYARPHTPDSCRLTYFTAAPGQAISRALIGDVLEPRELIQAIVSCSSELPRLYRWAEKRFCPGTDGRSGHGLPNLERPLDFNHQLLQLGKLVLNHVPVTDQAAIDEGCPSHTEVFHAVTDVFWV